MKLLVLIALCAFAALASGHKYKSGECPMVEPMSGFDMRKVIELEDFLVGP